MLQVPQAVDILSDEPVARDVPKRLAYSYLRYSSEQQMTKASGAEGDSIRRQIQNQNIAVEKYNLRLVDTYEDKAISSYRGKNRKKGALKDFLQAITDGKIPAHSYMLIESFDRLSRERMINGLSLVLLILQNKIKIITTDDLKLYDFSIEGKDLEQAMLIGLLLERANNESLTKSRRQKAKWEGRREKIISGEKKFLNKNVPWWIALDEKTGTYSLIEERVKEIRVIIDLLVNKNLGFRAAAAHINQHNPLKETFGKGATTKGWTARGIKRLVETPSIYGSLELCEYVYDNDKATPDRNTIKVMDNFYPAIFTKDEIDFVKLTIVNRMTTDTKTTRRDLQYYNVFHGLMKCEHCGGNIRFSQKQKYWYLVCRNSEINLCAYPKALSLQYQRFNEVFFSFAKYYNFERLVESFGENVNDDTFKKIGELEKEILVAKHKEEKFTEQILEKFDGEISDAQQKVMKKYADNIRKMSDEIVSLKGKINPLIVDGSVLSDGIAQAKELVNTKDGRLILSNHLASVISKIVVRFGKPSGSDWDTFFVKFKADKQLAHGVTYNKEKVISFEQSPNLFLSQLRGKQDDKFILYTDDEGNSEWIELDFSDADYLDATRNMESMGIVPEWEEQGSFDANEQAMMDEVLAEIEADVFREKFKDI